MSFTEVPRDYYNNYDEFATKFLLTVIEEGCAFIVINYMDYVGVIQSLNTKVINGKTLCFDVESDNYFDDDIKAAMRNKEMMLVSVFKESAKIIGEPVLYENPESFASGTYFVEKDASEFLNMPITGKVIPFEINKRKLN